ncbi:heparan-alpha-glucosaminide N-acetyltransferase [soil metagenome]
MMVLYHFMYDLDTFGGYEIESTSGFWARFADLTAFSFVFLVGVSLAISYTRSGVGPGGGPFVKFLFRGAKVIGYGMVLTFVTWFLGMGIIVFGILHLIGTSIILAYPFLRFRLPNLILGLAVICVGWYLQTLDLSSESPWLIPVGVLQEGLFMPDYRPLLPWFGVVLLGVYVGNLVYGSGKRMAEITSRRPFAAQPLTFLGRHSLLIYLVHQPILVGLLAALGIVSL